MPPPIWALFYRQYHCGHKAGPRWAVDGLPLDKPWPCSHAVTTVGSYSEGSEFPVVSSPHHGIGVNCGWPTNVRVVGFFCRIEWCCCHTQIVLSKWNSSHCHPFITEKGEGIFRDTMGVAADLTPSDSRVRHEKVFCFPNKYVPDSDRIHWKRNWFGHGMWSREKIFFTEVFSQRWKIFSFRLDPIDFSCKDFTCQLLLLSALHIIWVILSCQTACRRTQFTFFSALQASTTKPLLSQKYDFHIIVRWLNNSGFRVIFLPFSFSEKLD